MRVLFVTLFLFLNSQVSLAGELLKGGEREWDARELRGPEVVRLKDGKLVMLFMARSNKRREGISVAFAERDKPSNWEKSNKLILPSGPPGSWDEQITSATAIFEETDGWKILYSTISGGIGLATGKTLFSLTKYSGNPVFSGDGKGWNSWTVHPELVKNGSTYYLFFDARNHSSTLGQGGIGLATSKDLVDWQLVGDRPILKWSAADWEKEDVGYPSVERVGDQWIMAYVGYDGAGSPWVHSIGLARSANLIRWVKDQDNPVLTPRKGTSSWDSNSVHEPSIHYVSGKLIMFYAGNTKPGNSRIGMVELTNK